jgi:hypothetical protein
MYSVSIAAGKTWHVLSVVLSKLKKTCESGFFYLTFERLRVEGFNGLKVRGRFIIIVNFLVYVMPTVKPLNL